jgi:hypothetical protein
MSMAERNPFRKRSNPFPDDNWNKYFDHDQAERSQEYKWRVIG